MNDENKPSLPPAGNAVAEAEAEAKSDVGYGKPPIEHQFKKGQSGNPKGRRSKANSDIDGAAMMRNLFAQPVHVSEGGKRKKMSFLEAGIRKDLARWLNGTGPFPKYLSESLKSLLNRSQDSGQLSLEDVVRDILNDKDTIFPTEPTPKNPIL